MRRLAGWLSCGIGAATLTLLAASSPRGAAGGGKRRGLPGFAAPSPRDPLGKLAEAVERSHPGVQVRFNFAGSQELRRQMEQGAPADVFASADLRQFDSARGGGLVGAPRIFTTNEPVIVVPRANPARVTSLADLPRVNRVVLGTPEVPIGTYTREILDKANARYGGDF